MLEYTWQKYFSRPYFPKNTAHNAVFFGIAAMKSPVSSRIPKDSAVRAAIFGIGDWQGHINPRYLNDVSGKSKSRLPENPD